MELTITMAGLSALGALGLFSLITGYGSSIVPKRNRIAGLAEFTSAMLCAAAAYLKLPLPATITLGVLGLGLLLTNIIQNFYFAAKYKKAAAVTNKGD